MRSRSVVRRPSGPHSQTSLLLTRPTAVPGGRITDIGPTMDVPKDMSAPRIIITVIAVVDRTRHTTTYLTTTYPSRAQWEATVAGANSP